MTEALAMEDTEEGEIEDSDTTQDYEHIRRNASQYSNPEEPIYPNSLFNEGNGSVSLLLSGCLDGGLMASSLVACFSVLVSNFIMGTSLIAGLMGSFFLFSGYFIAKDGIPKYWIFMHCLRLFKYPFECFMINEYGGEKGKRKCLEIIEGNCYLYGEGFLKQQGRTFDRSWMFWFTSALEHFLAHIYCSVSSNTLDGDFNLLCQEPK
ncbi:hypothetical protein NC652_041471 [Populus alba x Populus x berolinensis]|nr:hypothetical protein NC652_041471 [Populus alba x Populus x berolinensis]